ncbi:MAG: glycoside hydrolase family 25 protein [Candidatus Fimenecus sp.]
MEKMFNGIDVSKWQGEIDWKKVKAAGVQFAILRDGYGRYPNQADATFETNYQNAKAAGLYVGAYHYSYAKTAEEAKQEAAYCLSLLKGKVFDFPICYDIEDACQATLSKEEISNIADAFCSELEKAGYYVCLYMNLSWLNSKLCDDIFRKYDIWLAHWTTQTNFSRVYGLWQYTSNGTVDGIKGKVDLDYAYKNYPSIMAKNGLNGYKKASQPNSPSAPTAQFPAQMMVTLHNTPLYVSATAKKPAAHKSGTFYIYDGKEINGRYRITSSPARAGKTPMAENVTGYVNKTDLR